MTFYAPLDFSWATRRAVARIKPTVLVLVELELWPNLVAAAKAHGAKVAIVNGRLSERSHRGYRRIRWALKRTWTRMDGVSAQTEEYARRFVDLGLEPSKVRVTGSVKYDGLETDRGNPRTNRLRRELGLSASELVFVAGSTMEGEEDAAISAYLQAREAHPRLRLVLVPRHAERFEQVAGLLRSRGVPFVRRSRPGEVVSGGRRVGRDPGGHPGGALGRVGPGRRGVRGRQPVSGPQRPEHDGGGGLRRLRPVRPVHEKLQGRRRRAAREAAGRGGSRTPRAWPRRSLEDLDDPETASRAAKRAARFVLAQRGAAARTVAELERLGRRAG